jgi:hypothetical protein
MKYLILAIAMLASVATAALGQEVHDIETALQQVGVMPGAIANIGHHQYRLMAIHVQRGRGKGRWVIGLSVEPLEIRTER